ncbi:hypothetical protein [Bradyrhizobium lablabi]|uniref:hypothetical protein n=1 Tax=Bradyrhizobium lablabi TaxID=722472 RepID=UPI002896A3E7|nr:hypothetical protein [Bradyrhizobium lablabi]
MSIRTRIAAAALAARAVTGTMGSTTLQAEAGWLRGLGAEVLGATMVESTIAASDGYHYELSPPRPDSPVRRLRQLCPPHAHLRLID